MLTPKYLEILSPSQSSFQVTAIFLDDSSLSDDWLVLRFKPFMAVNKHWMKSRPDNSRQLKILGLGRLEHLVQNIGSGVHHQAGRYPGEIAASLFLASSHSLSLDGDDIEFPVPAIKEKTDLGDITGVCAMGIILLFPRYKTADSITIFSGPIFHEHFKAMSQMSRLAMLADESYSSANGLMNYPAIGV